ncbi:hypothetical protein PG996_008961 [Apiospora saccharicola]|uniref:Heterokaryon incompatibility domain-containing protein n=1 Tax=Apiospora saccharicola TaxID=335842 RepID=A0ABR1V2L1_9PEZI
MAEAKLQNLLAWTSLHRKAGEKYLLFFRFNLLITPGLSSSILLLRTKTFTAMRLIDAKTIELVEFIEEAAPKYAILSHRWEEDEVALREVEYLSRRQWAEMTSQTIRAKKGYVKLQRASALALEHGCQYIWVDTCCIDKTSSAELSEAINSMYRWYKNAVVCIAFLSDAIAFGSIWKHFHIQCRESLWFTRGWTLQELVAPVEVLFYGREWKYLGSRKNDKEVRDSLHQITGIDIRVLDGSMHVSEVSVAERMKWASSRRTSRAEDMAYSLLGIFDVNMPLLYGEGGSKAFIRLQEEILRTSNDQTIFIWRVPDIRAGQETSMHGLLAEHPRYFSGSAKYRPLPPVVSEMSTAWSTTNQGMRLSLLLQPLDGVGGDRYLAILECSRRQAGDSHWSPAVVVHRLYGDQFARTQIHMIDTVPTPLFEQQSETATYETVFIKQRPVVPVPDFMISFDNLKRGNTSNPLTWPVEVYPPKSWDNENGVLSSKLHEHQTPVGLIRFASVSLHRCLDLIVGLERTSRGAWKPWWSQRLASQHVSANRSFHEFVNLDRRSRFEQSPSLSDWQPETKFPVQFKIEEQKVHGRPSFLIKALTTLELPGETVDPPLPFLIYRVPKSTDEKQGSPPERSSTLSGQLQNLLGDVMVRASFNRRYPTTWLESSRWIRTSIEMVVCLRRGIEETPICGHTEKGTRFLRWCKEGNLSGVLSLLEEDPLSKDLASIDDRQILAIHWAAAGGHTTIIEQLLHAGVPVGSQTSEGWTPMHFAALFGRFKTLNWLMRYEMGDFTQSVDRSLLLGARHNALKESPLHFAMSQVWATEDDDELAALVELTDCLHGSHLVTQKNSFGETPMHRLAGCGISAPARKKGSENSSLPWMLPWMITQPVSRSMWIEQGGRRCGTPPSAAELKR